MEEIKENKAKHLMVIPKKEFEDFPNTRDTDLKLNVEIKWGKDMQ